MELKSLMEISRAPIDWVIRRTDFSVNEYDSKSWLPVNMRNDFVEQTAATPLYVAQILNYSVLTEYSV